MKNKNDIIEVNNKKYLRMPVKTHILSTKDNMFDIIKKYAGNILQKDDIISISESPLAITQGRAVFVKDIKVSLLAKILWRFVAEVPYGIGLRSPYSMQCAIDECGSFRIFLAAIGGFFGKLIKRKGFFYKIAGMQAALIDAANTSPVPPFTDCVIKGPKNPEKIAQKLKEELGYEIAVMDINDIGGCWLIGQSDRINKSFMEKVMKDNPQGQSDELTPICIIRKI